MAAAANDNNWNNSLLGSPDGGFGGSSSSIEIPQCVIIGMDKLLKIRPPYNGGEKLVLQPRPRAGAVAWEAILPNITSSFQLNGVNVVYLLFNKQYFFVPFGPAQGKTDKDDINNLIAWASDSAERVGQESFKQGRTDCTAQALVFTHQFRKIDDSIIPPRPPTGIQDYQDVCRGAGGGGIMNFALNSDMLLNAIFGNVPTQHFTYFTLYSPSLPTNVPRWIRRTPNFHSLSPQMIEWEAQRNLTLTKSVELFIGFMRFLKIHNLIIPNSKFIINNQWSVQDITQLSDSPFTTEITSSAHAQLFAWYESGSRHFLHILDTQIPSATLVDSAGASITPEDAQDNIIKGRGVGGSFEDALADLQRDLLGRRQWRDSRSFSIICIMPKIDEIMRGLQRGGTQKQIIQHSITRCNEAMKTGRVQVQLAQARQSVHPSIGLQLNKDDIKLVSSTSFNPQLAQAQSVEGLQKFQTSAASSPGLHSQALNTLQACFPSTGHRGSIIGYNPLESLSNWHILKTKKILLPRLGGRGESSDELLGLLGTKVETHYGNRVCGMYSVCTRRHLGLQNVCKVLMSQSIIREMSGGQHHQNFFLGVRLGTIDPRNPSRTPDLTAINIAAIKCYIRCGFSFRRLGQDSGYWPENEVERQALLKVEDFGGQLSAMLKFIGGWSLSTGKELLSSQNSGGSSKVSRKDVVYGRMYLRFNMPYILPDFGKYGDKMRLPSHDPNIYFHELHEILENYLNVGTNKEEIKNKLIAYLVDNVLPASGGGGAAGGSNLETYNKLVIDSIRRAHLEDIPKIIYLLQYSAHEILRPPEYRGGKKKKTRRKKKKTSRKNKKKSKRKKKKTRRKNKRKRRIKTKRKKRKTNKKRKNK